MSHTPDAAEVPPLERLLARWRERADEKERGERDDEIVYLRCAEELELALRAEGEARRRVPPAQNTWEAGVHDAAEGIRRASTRHPALMNPETMLHIAENLALWAWHAHELAAALVRSSAPQLQEHAEDVSRVEPGATTPSTGSTAKNLERR